MERNDAKKTPRIRYLSRREMLALMGSTAAAITLAGCGGSEKSGEPGSGGETTGASTSAAGGGTTGATAETASTTCVVRPEQTEGPYYVDTGLDRSDIREEREGVPPGWWTSGTATRRASTRASRTTPPGTSTPGGRRSCAGTR